MVAVEWSPDEVALVKIAESISMRLIDRTQAKMNIENAAGKNECYQILANFPFTSESKRMGIIVRHVESRRILFYLKGADTIILKALSQEMVDEVLELSMRHKASKSIMRRVNIFDI